MANGTKATRIEGTNDYRYRGIRVYVKCGQYRGQKNWYYVADFVLRDSFGRLNPKIQFSSLSEAKAYIDTEFTKPENQ